MKKTDDRIAGMKAWPKKYKRWIIAAGVILAIAAGLVIQAVRTPAREVMFLLKFSEPVRPNVVTQGEIDAVLGKGYTLTFSDSYGSLEKSNLMKIVGLKIPDDASSAEVATLLERLPQVKSVEVMKRNR